MPRVSKKTCIPGLFCIENMTMFLLFLIVITVIYMYYAHIIKPSLDKTNTPSFTQPILLVNNETKDIPATLIPKSTRNDPLESLYTPPLKTERTGLLPINVPTRGPELNYSQMGILTRENGHDDMILPLMGRRSSNGRDKYQYYTMSNSAGNINTKLPVSLKGKSCSSEYGCDEIYSGDSVYVEGYNDTFRATIYENNLFRYIPF